MSFREQKTEQLLRELAADFLQRESNRLSLITVTGIEITNNFANVTVLISVLPESGQDDALEFAKRKRSEFRQYIKEHSKLQRLPVVDFRLDIGEKNRQKIDSISSQENL